VDVKVDGGVGTVSVTVEQAKFDSQQALSKLQADWPDARLKG
jgi:hypothetical protein